MSDLTAAELETARLFRVSTDWAQRLRDEFGLRCIGTPTRDRTYVLIEPEDLYGKLSEVVGLLRDCGAEDHPLRPQEFVSLEAMVRAARR